MLKYAIMQFLTKTLEAIARFFTYYVDLTGPASLIAILLGGLGILLGLAALFLEPIRKAMPVLVFIAILPLLVGLGGSLRQVGDTLEIYTIEGRGGPETKSSRYYDSQYGYNEFMYHAFPAIVGTVSTIPALFLLIVAGIKGGIKNLKKGGKE